MILSSIFFSLFDGPFLILVWALTLAFTGAPLLWRFLNYKPVSRCAVVQAMSNLVASGCSFTFGSAAMTAHARGLIALPTAIIAVALLLATVAGGSFLIARWCPDEQS